MKLQTFRNIIMFEPFYTACFYLNIEYEDVLARYHIFVIHVKVIKWQRFSKYTLKVTSATKR